MTTLNDTIKIIKVMNEKGYNCWFKGNGDGTTTLIIENPNNYDIKLETRKIRWEEGKLKNNR